MEVKKESKMKEEWEVGDRCMTIVPDTTPSVYGTIKETRTTGAFVRFDSGNSPVFVKWEYLRHITHGEVKKESKMKEEWEVRDKCMVYGPDCSPPAYGTIMEIQEHGAVVRFENGDDLFIKWLNLESVTEESISVMQTPPQDAELIGSVCIMRSFMEGSLIHKETLHKACDCFKDRPALLVHREVKRQVELLHRVLEGE